MPRRRSPDLLHLPPLRSVSLNGYKLDVERFLINPYDDISEASTDLPAVIEWINERYQEAVCDKINLAAKVAKTKGEVYLSLRSGEFERLHGTKPTDKALDAAVSCDDRVLAAIEELATVTGWVARLGSLRSSFQAKLDLLRSSEATKRKVFPDRMREDDDHDHELDESDY